MAGSTYHVSVDFVRMRKTELEAQPPHFIVAIDIFTISKQTIYKPHIEYLCIETDRESQRDKKKGKVDIGLFLINSYGRGYAGTIFLI